MYRPNIRLKFIYRLYRVRNTIKHNEGRTLSFREMVEEALSEYLYWKETGLGMSPRELPEAKLDGAWYSLDHRLRERRKLLILEKRMHEQPRTMGDYKE